MKHDLWGTKMVGLVALLQQLPAAAVAALGSTLGGRYDRRRALILVYAALTVAIVAAGVAMIASAPAPVVYILACSSGWILTLVRPTYSALLPWIVDTPQELTLAFASNGLIESVSIFVGPMLVGTVLAFATGRSISGPGLAYLALEILLLVGTFLVWRMHPTNRVEDDEPPETFRLKELGSIPFGLLVVKLKTGKDIRQVESGRTGGTNALRAAGFWAGLLTALMGILKGAMAVWLARWLAPEDHLLHVIAPLAAILGHSHSIFLPERNEQGRIVRLRGGAGGAPSVGGALGIWAPSVLIILPLGTIVFFTFGYASITTISVALFATIIFAVPAFQGQPWVDVLYGVAALLLLLWALRPNIRKLIEGKERVVSISLNGRIKARKEKETAAEAVSEME